MLFFSVTQIHHDVGPRDYYPAGQWAVEVLLSGEFSPSTTSHTDRGDV